MDINGGQHHLSAKIADICFIKINQILIWLYLRQHTENGLYHTIPNLL
jgi:hypothetical protein